MKAFLSTLALCSLACVAFADAPDKPDVKPDEPAKKADDPVKKADDPAKKADELIPAPAEPPAKLIAPELILVPGEASAVPHKKGIAYANGGIIDVAQPNPTTIVVTMTGLAAVNADLCGTSMAGYDFDLNQCFEVQYSPKAVKGAHLSLEGKVMGLLRTNWSTNKNHSKRGGTAETLPGVASISCGPTELVGLTLPPRAAACGEDLSVYNHEGPIPVPVTPGRYALHESWGFRTSHPAFLTRGASAEFAPQPSYVPDANAYWFHDFQPFNGTATKDFGFQVTIKLLLD
jgi:hypothetical protein